MPNQIVVAGAVIGGEVERGLSMRKALGAHLPVILVVNKTDRPDARIAEVVSGSHDLLLRRRRRPCRQGPRGAEGRQERARTADAVCVRAGSG